MNRQSASFVSRMETWFIIVVSLCIAALIRSIILHRKHHNKLPPGPSLLHSTFLHLISKPVLINLKTRYGPIFTLYTGLVPSIFITSRSLAHQVLVIKGAVSSDRPKFFLNFNIGTCSYGPTWRLLRRNLATEIMHPTRIKSYSWARKWAFHILISRLLEEKDDAAGVKVYDHFHNVMFSLLVLMCFGEELDESRVDEFVKIQREMLSVVVSGKLSRFPGRLGRLLFRNLWKQFEKLRDDREQMLLPIIKSRLESDCLDEHGIMAYVDTLGKLRLPEDEVDNRKGGKLTDKEMVNLCSEFVTGGTDSTSSALQWIMANLVKHPHIQSKLYDEIVAVVGPVEVDPESVINEEDIQKMRYLKAVVLEGLRRHPPIHFPLPHRVMKEMEVEGYTIPEGATINFMVAEMGLDPKVWDEPLEFKPERFLVNDDVFDISGSKEIKMMPFGAGRRICPGSDLGFLHLEYFVANLIWYFHWTVPNGYNVDFSEKAGATVIMENPLRARISSRAGK
ncbi:putative cytochrome P450 [Helianthus annuus]|uniref:Cytochrome P450 n=1 Tax=Helianthus annuus TaxID=4232 RepID=A0A251S2I2_HELAN|nr:cytochrome P450 89A2 [Helianthus annuus]KAF5761958.1 putative cytochrome P450 [Helianthus annuus]KAJ0439718.1 putative cytochrome P450 [Helianthus annuus]KAJ0444914.1 putative cytochrome P450 [Helianthus annuus]KAJ0642503.1 putative cytochrome P450 [Helianthus annuus]KAJ0646377.1 putative cytochrome P450 [Helianthus annuus]